MLLEHLEVLFWVNWQYSIMELLLSDCSFILLGHELKCYKLISFIMALCVSYTVHLWYPTYCDIFFVVKVKRNGGLKKHHVGGRLNCKLLKFHTAWCCRTDLSLCEFYRQIRKNGILMAYCARCPKEKRCFFRNLTSATPKVPMASSKKIKKGKLV